jgi:hypothetical protein
MTTCESLRPRAAGIASLPSSDPERQEFLAHAAGCPDCLRALSEAEAVLLLLDSAPRELPSAASLERVAEQIRAELRLQRLAPALLACAAALAWAVMIAVEPHLAASGWSASVAATGLAAALAALVGAPRLGVLGATAGSAGLALAAGRMPGLFADVGKYCVVIEQLCALLPAATAVWLARRGGALSAWSLAQAAATGALAGAAALHLSCPAHHASVHLWVFHVGGVIAAAAIAAALARPLHRFVAA